MMKVAFDDEVTAEQVKRIDDLVAPEFATGRWIDSEDRDAVIEECATNLAAWYPDNVSTNAFCAALRSMKSEATRS